MTTNIAVPDADLPGAGDGDQCGIAQVKGFFIEALECPTEGGLFFRIICDQTQFDIHPTRILVSHGANVSLELHSDKIITKAPILEHTGNMKVTGDLEVTHDIKAGRDIDAGRDVGAVHDFYKNEVSITGGGTRTPHP